jgi:transketolase
MRTAFVRTLLELAEQDERICLIVGDLGFGVVEPFAQRFPSRFVNAGVAEQNMAGIAAGMALCGMVVFMYSIGNFPTLRCVEQIRNDICYHNANVKIVSVGAGFGYGALGMSHHATEDVSILRALPRMTVVSPGDPVEAEAATRAVAQRQGPCYLRLGRSGERAIHPAGVDFVLGKAITLREGHDVCIIVAGELLDNVVQVARRLSQVGIQARVISMHTIEPLDTDAVLAAVNETSAIVTVEEHSIIGGLGSAVAEVLAEGGDIKVPFKRLGIPLVFASQVGSQEYLRSVHSLSVEGILKVLLTFLEFIR